MFGALSAEKAVPTHFLPVQRRRVVRWCWCCGEGLGYKNSDVHGHLVRGNPRIFLDPSPSVDFFGKREGGVKRDVENKIKDIEKKLDQVLQQLRNS